MDVIHRFCCKHSSFTFIVFRCTIHFVGAVVALWINPTPCKPGDAGLILDFTSLLDAPRTDSCGNFQLSLILAGYCKMIHFKPKFIDKTLKSV